MDVELLRQHRDIFERPGFQVSCIWELLLKELLEAIDDVTAALNTGSLYSRSGKLLKTFPSRNNYKQVKFRETFSNIVSRLTLLKRSITEFEEFFRDIDPGYSHGKNFYSMVMSLLKSSPEQIRKSVEFMDVIDQLRNDILEELNFLLSESGEKEFGLITLSSISIDQDEGFLQLKNCL